MENKISRRSFLVKTTVATAGICAGEPLIATAEQTTAASRDALPSASKPSGLVNVARNRAAYQSSSADDDHTAHLATDGSELTYWECKPNGEHWIAIDLGEAQSIAQVTLHWGMAFARSYRIEVSSEGLRPRHWTAVYATTEGKGGVEEVPLKALTARHVRMTGTAEGMDRGFSITEFEVWGAGKARSSAVRRPAVIEAETALTDGWSLESAMFTSDTPESISSTGYSGGNWLPAVVPGTVLASYLACGAIPDPNFGNQQTQISEEFFTRNDFWYRNTFVLSSKCRGRRIWIAFDGINWKADVYLNGRKLGEINGAFVRSRFDITNAAIFGGENCLAVLVRRVAHPGPIMHKRLGETYRNGGILGLDSPTFVSSIGWNWVPTIRGRNVGIWNDVRVEMTGDVLLVDPWVTSELPSTDNARADLTVKAELRNLSDQSRRCVLVLSLDKLSFRKEISLEPQETLAVAVDKAAWKALEITNPRLWWPNGYGEANLYTMSMRLESGRTTSDEKQVIFGIRKMDYRVEDNVLNIFVNGHRMLCRGGNWGMEDGMLICDKDGYDLRVRMHRDMNLMMIRNWVGMVGRDALYEACDRHGILIWDDFWLANPIDGPDPTDHAMFMSNAQDKIRRVRSHASLALYCGRNEGVAPPDLDAGMRDAVSILDGTRYYLPASASGTVTGHGPYDNQDPEWYFVNRGKTFHSELGIVCVPPVESMRAMMAEEDLWPISDVWAVHDYQNPRSVLYTKRIEHRYGAPSGIEDYCRKAQMVNLESAKAMFECLRSRRGSGILMWMTQSAWPALICQLYDYYFEQTAAYFGVKVACEPVHILWDPHRNVVAVANDTTKDQDNLRADAWVLDLSGKERWHKSVELEAQPSSTRDCFALDVPNEISGVHFVKLTLSRAHSVVSENFYWGADADGTCADLEKLARVTLPTTARMTSRGSSRHVNATISNPTSTPALAVRLKLTGGRSGERVLPVMYGHNYFSLLPHESKTVNMQFQSSALRGEVPRLVVEGWNIEHGEVGIQGAG
jgi:Exo-beta-D-glucosaminidase Ig-fold domain/F5/8 type C domain/Glycosyl hydrolases family 2/Glycosyl hydrolases family 2, sugar binding domain